MTHKNFKVKRAKVKGGINVSQTISCFELDMDLILDLRLTQMSQFLGLPILTVSSYIDTTYYKALMLAWMLSLIDYSSYNLHCLTSSWRLHWPNCNNIIDKASTGGINVIERIFLFFPQKQDLVLTFISNSFIEGVNNVIDWIFT